MELCPFCTKFTSWITKSTWVDDSSTFNLDHPGETCYLCEEFVQNPGPTGNTTTFSAVRERSALRNGFHLVSEVRLWTMAKQFIFTLWADEGSPASIAFATQPPILRPRMEEASDFANAWLGECKAFHNICSSGQESTLPARVLSISGIREVPTIKLIDTNGKKGRYIALSHCWGPINKRPLRTTRSNIDDHHVGIPFAHLPKTFRDAVWFTQAIGIDYIWIDSLAIIQDDEVDWHSEAQNMGAVYRNATLVIAAAGARDSTRGLFVSERPHATTKKIPYIVQGVPQGTFNMARRAPCVISVADSRLNKRAWALQERYLARRIMFFMPYEVSWKCRTSQVSEGGSITELGFVDQNGWLNMLEQYSHKKLTMPQDRLYALRGIVDEMAQARTGKFLYDYGVWEDGLHSQLLWRQEEGTAETDSMGLPSWSWASLGGGKCWLMDSSAKPRYMTKALHINSNGSLITTGHLSTRPYSVQRISDNSRYKFVLVDRSMDAKYPVYLIQSSYADSRVIGTATYDRLPTAAVRCFFVASTQNFQHRVWPSFTGLDESLEILERAEISRADEKDPDCEPRSSSGSPDKTKDQYATEALSPLGPGNSRDIRKAVPRPAKDKWFKRLLSRKSRHYESLEPSVTIDVEPQTEAMIDSFLSLTAHDKAATSAHANYACKIVEKDLSETEHNANVAELTKLQDRAPFVYWALLLEPMDSGKYRRVGLAMLHPDAPEAVGTEVADIEIV